MKEQEAVSIKYKMITSDDDGHKYNRIPRDVLNGLSDDGWEMVFMTIINGDYYIQVKGWK